MEEDLGGIPYDIAPTEASREEHGFGHSSKVDSITHSSVTRRTEHDSFMKSPARG